MLNRLLCESLREDLNDFPAVAIVGPRQIGKTTLAKQVAARSNRPVHYLDLEDPRDLAKLKDDAITYLENYKDHCVIIDEMQTLPELFSWFRPLIDRHRVPGRFLVLGSASPVLVKGISQSLAGRISYRELGSLNLKELETTSISMESHWFRGGFPEPLLAKTDRFFHAWAENFVISYAERDLNFLFGVSLTPALVRKLWLMLAHGNGGIWNAETHARSLGVTAPTVNRYLDFMEGAYLIRKLPPWFSNAKKRLIKSPKVYIRATGVLHSLLGIRSWDDLQGHPVVGTSWESYVIEQIWGLKPEGTHLYFYRTQNGAECDVVIAKGMMAIACIEIKYSNAPVVSRGFYSCIEDLGTSHNFVLTPGSETYPKGEKVMVCGLKDFLFNHLPRL
ncbi:MAG: ATP-binding protein [Cytophagales bacterium]